MLNFLHVYFIILGSGCGAVGRTVASNSRGSRFESNLRQFYKEPIINVNIENVEKKRPRKAHFYQYFQTLKDLQIFTQISICTGNENADRRIGVRKNDVEGERQKKRWRLKSN